MMWYYIFQRGHLFFRDAHNAYIKCASTGVLTAAKLYDQEGQERIDMEDKERYYIVNRRAVPEVLLKVVEAKRLLDSERVLTIQEATDTVGISRSSFYKYKDDIYPFHENTRGKTINVMMQLDDVPGLLSNILNEIAENGANILTIHQTIPIGGIASTTLGIELLPDSSEVTDILDRIGRIKGVNYMKILGRE